MPNYKYLAAASCTKAYVVCADQLSETLQDLRLKVKVLTKSTRILEPFRAYGK